MNADLHARAKALFLATSGERPEDRQAFLDQRCAGDDALRREVSSLFEHFDEVADRPEPVERARRAEPDSTPGEVENYRFLRKMGEGGMGEVWEAQQERPLKRRVALKILKAHLDSKEFLARFDSERQALALMEHPNIATVFDAGSNVEGRPYFAMEYVEGVSIIEFCRINELDLERRLELFGQVCRGVQHAHERGVIHRDLKPSNLLVTWIDGEPVPKVIDFGVARATGQPLTDQTLLTETGRWIGTPEYMSPEQAEMGGSGLDGRTDVYSLGVVLYELLTGFRPFESDHGAGGLDEIRRRIVDEEPTKPSSRVSTRGSSAEGAAAEERATTSDLARRLRGDLDRIALRALERDRRRRYTSPGELAGEIARYLKGEPVLAAGPGARARLRRYVRRHPSAVAGGALVLAAVIAVAGSVLWIRARDALETTETAEPSRTVAVLPFLNLGGDPGDEYLGDGLSEELLNALATAGGLRVAARTSSFAFKGKDDDVRTIGEKLGVGAVLEGSVRRSGDRLRVSAQLIDTATGFHLWARTVDRRLDDVFLVQDEIATAVAEALQVEVAKQQPGEEGGAPTDVATYDLYLRGRHLVRDRSPQALAEAVALFEQAIALDPGFAPAYAGLAEGYIFLALYGDLAMGEAHEKVRTALERALQLDNQLADAHATLGLFWLGRKEPETAEKALRRALELNENHAAAHLWLGHALLNSQRPEEADAEYERAVELDPLNPRILDAVAMNLTQGGNYEEGMEIFRRRLAIDPRSAETYRLMALTARTHGRLDYAVRWARQAVSFGPDGVLNTNELTLAYAALGDVESAFEWFERSFELGARNLWTPALESGLYFRDGQFREHEAFTRELWESRPPPESGPLSQEDKLLLVLEARSAILREDWAGAAKLLERAFGDPPGSILEVSMDIPTLADLAYVYRELGESEKASSAIGLAWQAIEGLEGWAWPRLILPDTISALHWMEGDREAAVATLLQAEADGWKGWGFRGSLWEEFRQEEELRAMTGRIEAELERMLEELRREEI